MDLQTYYEKIVTNMARWKSDEKNRASDAGDMREEIGNLLDLTGLNKKAFAFVRMLDKQEPDKREDILRSLKPLLEMMDTHWNGNKTPDMFDENEPVEPAAPGKPSYDPDADLSEIGVLSDDVGAQYTHYEYSSAADAMDEIAEETIAFDDQLARIDAA